MARAYICDRCGKLFDANKSEDSKDILYAPTICHRDICLNYAPMDICDQCIDSFKVWFENGKLNKKEN